MSYKEQLAAKEKYRAEEAEKRKKEAQSDLDIVVAGKPPGEPAAPCAPLGIMGLSPALATRISRWKRKAGFWEGLNGRQAPGNTVST